MGKPRKQYFLSELHNVLEMRYLYFYETLNYKN